MACLAVAWCAVLLMLHSLEQHCICFPSTFRVAGHSKDPGHGGGVWLKVHRREIVQFTMLRQLVGT